MKYFLKRVIGTIPVLLGVVLLIFVMLRIIPGNPVVILLGEHYDQATIDGLTDLMGYDQPILLQFVNYVKGALVGDLGVSYKYSRPVTEMIMEALPYTIRLALMAVVIKYLSLILNIVFRKEKYLFQSIEKL